MLFQHYTGVPFRLSMSMHDLELASDLQRLNLTEAAAYFLTMIDTYQSVLYIFSITSQCYKPRARTSGNQ